MGMDLRAARKAKEIKEAKASASSRPPLQFPTPDHNEREDRPKAERFPEVIAIRCNAILYNTIQNAVTSQHTAQDFTYSSPSDFIRASLQAYKDGMPLTELDEKGPKISSTMRVDQETKAFFSALPDRSRSKILERAIRTFMKNHK